VQAITRVAPGIWDSFKESFGARKDTSAAFIGTVEGNAFSLRRDILYRNSFLPQIRGLISDAPSGSRILVTMRLHPFVAVFICFWLLVVGAGAFAAFSNSSNDPAFSLIPIGMFVFGVALTLVGFYPEAYKARRLLENTIRGTSA
jgi:hypothetical protein